MHNIAGGILIAFLIVSLLVYVRLRYRASTDSPTPRNGKHYKVDDRLAELETAPQSEIPDDLKADAELPLDLKASLIAVAWTLGLAEGEAKVESVRHRITVSRETLERIIAALDDRGA